MLICQDSSLLGLLVTDLVFVMVGKTMPFFLISGETAHTKVVKDLAMGLI